MTTDRNSDELRREIAHTRHDMDRTLAELEDRVSPSRIRQRQTQKVRSRWHDARNRVMGSEDGGHSAREQMSGAAQDMQDTAEQAPERIESATQGNPLAAGLIAFGVGAVLGSAFPATRPEEQLASGLRDEFEEPMRRELQDAADESRQELEDHARQAAEDTKQSAQRGMERTRGEAEQRAGQVGEHAQQAARSAQGQQGEPQS